MRSICFFASYFTSKSIPYYMEVYLKELKKHFSEVVLFTSQKHLNQSSLDFLEEEGVVLKVEENQGFDFGMWYKAFHLYEVHSFDQVALVNDSCILFKSLDEFAAWASQDQADYKGMTFSEAVSPHLQSYFLVLNKKATALLSEYFKKQGVLTNIHEVIKTYEIGLSAYFLSHGLQMSAYMDNNGYKGEFSPYYYCIDHHLAQDIPLIKKKILFASYRQDELFTLARMNFNVSAKYYIKKIKELNTKLIIDFSKLKELDRPELNGFNLLKYQFNCQVIKLVRLIRGSHD